MAGDQFHVDFTARKIAKWSVKLSRNRYGNNKTWIHTDRAGQDMRKLSTTVRQPEPTDLDKELIIAELQEQQTINQMGGYANRVANRDI